jgi:hypothetical protein
MQLNSTINSGYPARLVEDLAKSGLKPSDMRLRPLGDAEKQVVGAAMGSDGYVIPYFDHFERSLQFYRARLYDQEKIKYLQAPESQNHIYFPLGFQKALQHASCVLVVEGEKKATKATKMGYAAVGVAGVDSWRTRNLVIPKAAGISQRQKGGLTIKSRGSKPS